MRPQDEDTWEAEYWDEILRDFGPSAYIEARFSALEEEERNNGHKPRSGSESWPQHS